MLKVLLKKQLAEVFKMYFYDAKKNKMRSRWAVAGWIVFFRGLLSRADDLGPRRRTGDGSLC